MRIGWIGVGLMGHGAAKNVLEKGHALEVLGNVNRAPLEDLVRRGAREAANPRAMAAACDAVFLALPSSVEVERAVFGDDGLLEAARPGFVLVDATTSDPASTRRIGAALRARGAEMVDAPMSRTPKQAEEGRLASFVGGERAALERVLPVIGCYADTVVETGPLGSAHTVKLLNNFLALATSAVVGEALAAAMTLGVDLATFDAAVRTGGADSAMYRRFAHWALEGDDTQFQATMRIGEKDLRYYRQMADAAELPTTMADAASQLYRLVSQLGHARQFMPVLPSILASLADGRERPLPERR